MKLNQFIFQRKIKKFRAGQEREKRFMNYNDIKSVLILYESELSEKNKKIKAILKSLQEDGKKVTLCGYVKKKKSESPTFDHSCMIDLSHINFFK